MRKANWIGCRQLAVAVMVAVASCSAQGAEFVVNGDFETDAEEFVVWPGYVGGTGDAGINPDEIAEWFGTGGRGINPLATANPREILAWPGAGGRGVNPIITGDSPFRDNGDNETATAFLQGTASIQQEVTGLTVGTTYALRWDFNARNCCGDDPLGILELNGNVIDVAGFSEEVFPVTGFEPWYQAEIEFVANSPTATIKFGTAPAFGGDSTLVLDNVVLAPNTGGDNLIVNGDFEGNAEDFVVWPGYTGTPPFQDNGGNQSHVAFLQGSASLSQIVTGLTVGEEYTLSLDLNSRNCCGDFPIAELYLDGELVEDFPGNGLVDGIVTAVGGTNDWYRYEQKFTATKTDLELLIQGMPSAGGDATLLIDNVSVASQGVEGDFNGDQLLTAIDIDLLSEEIRAGTNLPEFDLNGDNQVNLADHTKWVNELKFTYLGDADLNGEFQSADFVQVFLAGKYEDETPLNAGWEEGDWNADGDFTSGDFVAAFLDGGYELGPRQAVSAVPEPSAMALLLLGLVFSRGACRRRR